MKNLIKIIKKSPMIAIIGLFILGGLVYSGLAAFNNKNNQEQGIEEETEKEVRTEIIDKDKNNNSTIETVGMVKPETQIDVTSLTNGTVQNIFFNVGDQVNTNSLLVGLYDNSTLTSLNNAQTNYINTQSNQGSIERLSQESIRAAELGVENSKENLIATEISLESAKNNLDNAKSIKDKNRIDTKNNAVISYNSFLNFIFSGLNNVDYIIDFEDEGLNLTAIKPYLGVKNLSTLDKAQKDYLKTKKSYLSVSAINPTTEDIESAITKMETTLSLFKELIDDMIVLLDNTTTSASFTDSDLGIQKTSFINLRAATIAKQTELASIKQALGNLELFYNQEIDALTNAVSSAESRLEQAKIGVQNAETNLESTKKSKDGQLIGSKSSIDNAQGQLNLARIQAGNLSIKAPINGQITAKYVELGAEVSPGQKIAQISQTENLKIELGLPSEDIYRIKLFQTVLIQEELNGIITSIDPTADPVTKKVKIEISFDNKDKKLISGTFVNISIPLNEIEKSQEDSFFIPLRSITISQNENIIFVNNNGIAEKRNVEIGKTEGALVEIINGLSDKEELIIDGGKNLKEGYR